ncbi:unnamed protein product [Prorocentrum cordatum]|uniref:Uncharacterized protein n=1 Tax=Prorocentrum cordatum TaxID=2364126 RepID=A0ABN9TP57_9DINO|nr:unnamed protein product [Polarella glacialis]
MHGLTPCHGSVPSLQPPMYVPLTQTDGADVFRVLASSASLCSAIGSSVKSMPSALSATSALRQYGHAGSSKKTTSADLMASSSAATPGPAALPQPNTRPARRRTPAAARQRRPRRCAAARRRPAAPHLGDPKHADAAVLQGAQGHTQINTHK